MVQLTSDRITNQPINQLLRQPIVDTNAFFTTFIDLLQIYKKAHRNKLGKSHPKHKRVWQLIYGNRQQHRSMVKQLLKQPNYGFTIHWDHWKIVFDALNHQLQQQLPLLQTQKLSHTSLFASPAQHNVHETLSATSTPCPTTAHHQAPVPLQTTQLQTVSPLADASADENNQPTPTFIQRLRQFHQSHAVYFKFAKYLLIAVTIAIACIGTSVGIAVLLDLAFDLSATASVLSLVKEILIGVQTLVLLGAKELFQLGGMTYTMQEKGSDAITLSFKRDPGQMFVVGTEIRKGQFLNNESGPFRPNEATNYVKGAPTIIATQLLASAGKVYEITLANPGFQVLQSQLKDELKYLPTASAGYTLQDSSDGVKWITGPVQPFTASIAANQTSTSATLDSKFGTNTYEIEYNSSTSRYEYSVTSGLGSKTLTAHIADFTNEAQWTNISSKDPARRFQISNPKASTHIASTGTYILTINGGPKLTMTNTALKSGGRQLSYQPLASKDNIILAPTDAETAPNGPFRLTNGLNIVSTTAQFVDNVLTVVSGKTTYTITYGDPDP